jgi:hypothetical protein
MRKSSTIKDEQYKILMERMHMETKIPKLDKNLKLTEKFMTPRSCSTVVVNGGSEGLSMEAADWLRNSSKSILKGEENMEDSFWSKKAPSQKKNMWNNENVKDEYFAIDKPINTTRQLR